MKGLIFILVLIFLASCGSEADKAPNSSEVGKPKVDSTSVDNVLILKYQIDVSNKNITNTSDREVDLLFNGIDNYFGGQRNAKVSFRTECLTCEPVQAFRDGLLFAKRLLITDGEIKYYKADFNIPDSVYRIKLVSDERTRTNPKFNFNEGTGSIKYLGVSCNDADFNKVQLSFKTGEIVIDSLINASFFEYDLDKDGEMEQYLIGSRNCSQELVVLRIKKRGEKK